MSRPDADRLSTSMLVAAAAVRQARHDADPAVRRNALLARACLQACGPSGTRLLCAVDRAAGRGLLAVLEALYLPGLRAHYAWRKRHIRRWALQSCARGARQVLILGAGFDGLSLHLLAQVPALRVFEIERARSVAIKQTALDALGLHEPRLSLVAADLASVPVAATLGALPAFDPRCPSLIVAEGVLMYLDRAALRRLLDGLAQSLPGAELIATAMDRRASGAPGFARQRPWVGRWLERAGEPFRWGETREALESLLEDNGVRLRCLADPQVGDDPDPSPGEWLFAAALASRRPRQAADRDG